MPSADVSARVAWSDDAPAIAAVQVRAWRTSYADLLPPEVLSSLDPELFTEGWRTALARPADARNRVLVALERNLVTGFVLTGPATDPDSDPVSVGELTDLTVDPHQRGALGFLAGGLLGRGPDGAHRTLDLLGDGSTTVKQVRLHTQLSD